MTDSDDITFIRELFLNLLGREGGAEEESSWVAAVRSGISDRDIFRSFINSIEYIAMSRRLFPPAIIIRPSSIRRKRENSGPTDGQAPQSILPA
jgi:Domain of unknown function (DUF4214)